MFRLHHAYRVGKIDYTRMYAAMNEKENAQCFGVVRRKPSRGRPAAALWPIFSKFSPKIMRPVLSHVSGHGLLIKSGCFYVAESEISAGLGQLDSFDFMTACTFYNYFD